jgi:tRNA(Ile2) C34 agmatinyltransferase TiaS
VTPIRPALALLWPSFTFFPLAALGVLAFGAAGGDPVMVVIGLGLLATNILIVVNQAYFTSLAIEGDELIYRTNFGTTQQRVPIGALQRIDAKRYPGAHSGVSAPHFVARGRDTTVKVNTKPYRLQSFASLITMLRNANARIELDPFWSRVEAGEDVSKEIALTPRSRL